MIYTVVWIKRCSVILTLSTGSTPATFDLKLIDFTGILANGDFPKSARAALSLTLKTLRS